MFTSETQTRTKAHTWFNVTIQMRLSEKLQVTQIKVEGGTTGEHELVCRTLENMGWQVVIQRGIPIDGIRPEASLFVHNVTRHMRPAAEVWQHLESTLPKSVN